MATDYAPHGIRVNGVIPGYMDTPMTNWVDAEEQRRLLHLGAARTGPAGPKGRSRR